MRLKKTTLGMTAMMLGGCAGVQQAPPQSEVEVAPYTRRDPPNLKAPPARHTNTNSGRNQPASTYTTERSSSGTSSHTQRPYVAQVPIQRKADEIYDWAPRVSHDSVLTQALVVEAPPEHAPIAPPNPQRAWSKVEITFREGKVQQAFELAREAQSLSQLEDFSRTFITEEADALWVKRAKVEKACDPQSSSQCQNWQDTVREALQHRVEMELATCGGETCQQSIELAQASAPLVGDEIKDTANDVHRRVETQEKAIQAVKPGRIGVLLPLSDEIYGKAAQEALQLIKTAYPNAEFVVRDTKQNPEEALQQAQTLVLQEQVGALVGPIGTQENAPVSKFARGWGIPHVTLTLSPPPLLPGEIERTLRLRTNPLDLAIAVARHAKLEQSLTKVAIVVESGAGSMAQAEAFANEFKRLGGEVVRVVEASADPKKADDTMKVLLQGQKRQKAKADFDGVYLAMPPAKARSFLAHFDFWKVPLRQKPVLGLSKQKPVQVLGQMGWNHPMVLDRATRTTENAIFAEVFFTESRDTRTQDFVRRFFSRFNRKPTAFHAEVYDVLAFTIETEAQARADKAWSKSPREALRKAFINPKALPAVTGTLNVSTKGQAQPRVQLLTIQDETIRTRLSEDEEDYLRNNTQPSAGEGQR